MKNTLKPNFNNLKKLLAFLKAKSVVLGFLVVAIECSYRHNVESEG